MTTLCGPTVTPGPDPAPADATAAGAGLPGRPSLPGITDTPTDPACPGSRHGSLRAYRTNGCQCPDVLAAVLADAERRRVARAAARAAGERPRRSSEVDEWDVDAALWRARRWMPVPDSLTQAERKAVVLRLRRIGEGRSGLMSAEEICARTGISERTVDRYLREAELFDTAVAAARRGMPMPGRASR